MTAEPAWRAPDTSPATVLAEPASLFARVIIEVIDGRRSVHQVSRWTTTECFAALAGRVAVTRSLSATDTAHRPAGDVVVRRVRTHRVNRRVVEVAAVVETPRRVHALAMRLEARGPRWLITALEVG